MRTKIVATIGPASCAPEKIAQLAEAGVSVFRLNFSHGDPEFFRKVITAIREVEKNMKEAAKQLDFERAAMLRDKIKILREEN